VNDLPVVRLNGRLVDRVTLDLYGYVFSDAIRGVLTTRSRSSFHTHRRTRLTKVHASGDFQSGSDGTRTRDLRRDRPAF
jgi:hypothetical protein